MWHKELERKKSRSSLNCFIMIPRLEQSMSGRLHNYTTAKDPKVHSHDGEIGHFALHIALSGTLDVSSKLTFLLAMPSLIRTLHSFHDVPPAPLTIIPLVCIVRHSLGIIETIDSSLFKQGCMA